MLCIPRQGLKPSPLGGSHMVPVFPVASLKPGSLHALGSRCVMVRSVPTGRSVSLRAISFTAAAHRAGAGSAGTAIASTYKDAPKGFLSPQHGSPASSSEKRRTH